MLRNTQAAKRVEAVANSLMAGPKTALASCQATQANLQANVRMLSDYLQNSLPTALPRLTVVAGSAVSPTAADAITGSHFTTNSALRAPSSATSTAAEAADADGGQGNAAWSPLAALTAREVTAVEQVLGEAGALSREEQRTADLAQVRAAWTRPCSLSCSVSRRKQVTLCCPRSSFSGLSAQAHARATGLRGVLDREAWITDSARDHET